MFHLCGMNNNTFHSILYLADYKPEVNLQLDEGGISMKTDMSLKTEVVTETLETTKPLVLVLPTRISCEVRPFNAKKLGINVTLLPFLLLQAPP